LHTTIFSKENKTTEVQIRTEEMHKEADTAFAPTGLTKKKSTSEKKEEILNG